MKHFKALTSFLPALVVLAVAQWASAEDGSAYNSAPTSSSTYARVQYANQANLTRRFGINRDPTIQYISFDELYNKYNKGGSRPVAPATEEPSTSGETVAVHADDKMDDSRWTDEAAPDLRKGWTVERLQSVSPSKTRSKVPSSAFNKGIDQVYAYSNAFQNGQFTKDARPTTAKPALVQGPGEYAHAIADDHQEDHLGAGSELKTNAVVMETSWTDVDRHEEDEHWTTVVINDRSDSGATVASTSTKSKTKSGAQRPDGVQSAWRPFSGPTASPTTVSPRPKWVQKTTRPDTSLDIGAANGSEDNVLFYSEAQSAASRRPDLGPVPMQPTGPNVQRPGPQNPNVQRPDLQNPNPNMQGLSPQHPNMQGPLPQNPNMQGPGPQNPNMQGPGPQITNMQGPGPQNSNRVHMGMFPQQQFLLPPNSDPNQQLWVMPNVADNEVTRGSLPPTPRPFQGRPDERVKFAPPNFPQQSNQHPIVLPPNNQQPPIDRFQQGPPPPPGQWSSINPNFPLSRPNAAPTGPVSVAPQLLNPSGQVQPRPMHEPIHIPLPLPRPSGPLGSSPDNPLPGPPIALPGIPAFNMPQQPNNREQHQRFPSGPPHQFPDRIDGPHPADIGPQAGNNFVRGPQQPQFNPNGQQGSPMFNPNGQRPNFNRSPPPPPPSTPTSIIKSFFSKFFPFARSMDLDGIPIVDIDQLTNNGTNLTALFDAPPEVVAHLLKLSANSTSTEDSDVDGGATTDGGPSNTTMVAN